ncbi:hypothetical protein HW115_14110 [Verrucomicrobiaceae bacterium N1E253]|uniref:Uncharacterized protein n=1 Tax=Oceaniferula marina TaxID=2748318 RepID=A0A851GII7_9BACT|nr:hypothetical protein [Oceaniferula marina]NWK56752.1 hypothetical protein [Oceaniferula marina]
MKMTVLGPIVALVIGGAAGFIAGKNTAPEPEEKDATTTDIRSIRRSGGGSGSTSGGGSARSVRVKSASEALALPGQNSRLQALMDYYANLDPSQFEEEAAKLEDLPWSERIMVGYLLFSRWGEEDPTEALAYTKTMGFAGMFVSGTVMQSWASKDPQGAAQYYQDNPGEFRMSGMMGGRGRGGGASTAGVIATEWARQDSAGALTWAQSLEGRDQRDAIRNVFSESAKSDPSEAAAMLGTVTDPEAKKEAQNSVAREWGKQNWEDAQTWIASLPADDQAGASSQALRGLAETDPEKAAGNISMVPEGEARDDVMESIARQWGRDDPAAAASWVMANGSENAQKESIERVMPSWVQQDSAAAMAFINEQPEGGLRDSAASSYVFSNQGGDIQQNLSLAETIGDDRTRSRTIGMTVGGWMRQDKEAATNYLETTESISQESKDRIQNWSSGGRGRGRGRGR